jgi:soluble lytic murein transglycosylase-like protein
MDAVASLPPYAHVSQEAVQCAAQASLRYQVPELLLHAVVVKENGRMGQCVRNKNGTQDCGLAQINTSWVSHFAKFGIRLEHVLYDTCTNLNASAYILRDNYNKKKDWFSAVVAYNIGPNNWTPARYQIGYRYATDVVRYWWGFQNWVDAKNGVVRAPAAASARPQPARPAAPARDAGQLVFTTSPQPEN